ncbi:GNAT family N-acetyltransferase [Robertmurraya korlensis]|uniref:GNAT family N-acetyltransferase n=1 Tax=Robertmurraya korlensis TaxID=519977 RepID=UPI00203EA2F9|nr:GNAT family N-acetyltransferase [Robertmurraya korlensis]MCM3603698.1 GNAT family N-acetyltransferase [Robertmurraya korlensis]
MLKKFTPPFSNEIYEQLSLWVSQQQNVRGINIEVPMNLTSVIEEEDGSPYYIYIMYEEDKITAAASVVDILKTKDYEIGFAASNEQMAKGLISTVHQDLRSLFPTTLTAVIDQRATHEKHALLELGANNEVSEAQLMVSQLSGKKPAVPIELLEYHSSRHHDYRDVLMESFGDEVEETEAIIQLSLSQPSRTLYGIHVDGELVGTINLIRSDDAFITALTVRPTHQKKGIGRAALHEAVNMLFEEGYQSVSLDVEIKNTHALQLYEEVGFHIQSIFEFFRL